MEKYMLPCLNKALFGIECPGCGMQRAIMFILEGEFAKALHIFPAIYSFALLIFALVLHFFDRSRIYEKVIIGLGIINALIMIISYIYRLIN